MTDQLAQEAARRVEALLSDLRKKGWSGRVMLSVGGWPRLYLDLRHGRPCELGAAPEPAPITMETD